MSLFSNLQKVWSDDAILWIPHFRATFVQFLYLFEKGMNSKYENGMLSYSLNTNLNLRFDQKLFIY